MWRRSEPILFFPKVVESNIPWHKAVYGGPADVMLSSNPDPVYTKLWADKISLGYSQKDMDESFSGVYDGKNIVIDWHSGMSQYLAKYSTPSGNPLIHISKTPYMRVYQQGINLPNKLTDTYIP